MPIILSLTGSILLYLIVFYISAASIKLNVSKWARIVLVLLLPTVIAGIRYNVGWDYGSYLWGFELIADQTWTDIFSLKFLSEPIAFLAVEKAMSYFHSMPLSFAAMAVCCYLPAVLYVLEDWNQENDPYNIAQNALFLYLIWFYTFGLSALKQGIAVGICFYSLTYVFKRKPIKFLLTIAIAVSFHSSAIVFSVVYFIWSASGKIKSWKKTVAIVGCLVFIAGFDFFVGRFGGSYSKYVGQEVEGRNLTFWIMLAWLLIFYAYRNRLIALDPRNEALIILFAIGVALQFLGFTNAFTKRIGEYFLVVECLLLPQLPCIFTRESRRLGWYLIIILNIFLFIMQNNAPADAMGILPYKFIF